MSHGPQVCPGYGLSVFLGQAVMAHLIAAGSLSADDVGLSPGKPLPYSLDLYELKVRVTAQ